MTTLVLVYVICYKSRSCAYRTWKYYGLGVSSIHLGGHGCTRTRRSDFTGCGDPFTTNRQR
jgi:hypothetical protein